MESGLLVAIGWADPRQNAHRPVEEAAAELAQLSAACGVRVLDTLFCRIREPNATYLIGSGKAQEVADAAARLKAHVVIFSEDLAPIQQRNLEDCIQCKTIDRTQLILDIFARRAKSREGKCQVELAQLAYLLPRLTGKGVLLTRLGGGVGTRGPGEQKLEVDRRRIRQKIQRLREEIRGLSVHRDLVRRQRQRRQMSQIGLVGYTNAGKTTLLNALSGAHARVADQLFATLDPLTRRVVLPSGQTILLTDTVGFLYRLPHTLVEAFQSTLEETAESDLLVHVLDTSHPQAVQQAQAVHDVLSEIKLSDRVCIVALNKIDQAPDDAVRRLARQFPISVPISATTGEGLEALLRQIQSLV